MANAAETFDSIASEFSDDEITTGTGFSGSAGLRVNNRIFAMLVSDELILKLPAERCAELSAAGEARAWDRGQGKPMREWVAVSDLDGDRWRELVNEALAFVRG